MQTVTHNQSQRANRPIPELAPLHLLPHPKSVTNANPFKTAHAFLSQSQDRRYLSPASSPAAGSAKLSRGPAPPRSFLWLLAYCSINLFFQKSFPWLKFVIASVPLFCLIPGITHHLPMLAISVVICLLSHSPHIYVPSMKGGPHLYIPRT